MFKFLPSFFYSRTFVWVLIVAVLIFSFVASEAQAGGGGSGGFFGIFISILTFALAIAFPYIAPFIAMAGAAINAIISFVQGDWIGGLLSLAGGIFGAVGAFTGFGIVDVCIIACAFTGPITYTISAPFLIGIVNPIQFAVNIPKTLIDLASLGYSMVDFGSGEVGESVAVTVPGFTYNQQNTVPVLVASSTDTGVSSFPTCDSVKLCYSVKYALSYAIYRNGQMVLLQNACIPVTGPDTPYDFCFTDTGLTPSTTYTYELLLFDAAGQPFMYLPQQVTTCTP